jgi:O-antigen/teichoic acid export membrane protein
MRAAVRRRFPGIRRGIAPQVILNGIAVAVAKGKGLLLIFVIAGVAGTDAYGVWVQALVVVALGVMLAALGLPTAVVRFYGPADPEDRGRLLWTSLTLVAAAGLLVAAIVFALAPALAAGLGRDASDERAFQVAAALVPAITARTLMLNVARAQDRLGLFSGASMAFDLLDLLLIAVLVGATGELPLAFGASAAANTVVAVTLLAYLRHDFGRPHVGGVRPLLRYSLPLVPSQVSDEALARGDRVVVGGFLGPAAAGVYAALYALASIPNIANSAFMNVLFPRLVRLEPAAAARLVARSARSFAAVTLALVTLLALVAAPLAGALLQEAQPWGRSAGVVALVGIGVLFWGVGRITSLHLFLRKRTGIVFAVWGGAAAFNLVLNLILVPLFGMVGAAVATSVSYGAFLLVVLWLTRYARRMEPTVVDGPRSPIRRAAPYGRLPASGEPGAQRLSSATRFVRNRRR